MNRNFYFLVGQKYDPSDGKWKHPYRKSRLQKFDGDGTLTASETESCAYILGNSSLKVLYFEQYNVVVMIRWRQIGFRQPVAQNAFPAVFATISTGEGIKFGWKESAKSTLMSKSMTLGITYTGSRMERCTFGMLWNNFSKSRTSTYTHHGIFSAALPIRTFSLSLWERRGFWNRCDSRRRRLQWWSVNRTSYQLEHIIGNDMVWGYPFKHSSQSCICYQGPWIRIWLSVGRWKAMLQNWPCLPASLANTPATRATASIWVTSATPRSTATTSKAATHWILWNEHHFFLFWSKWGLTR